MREMRILIVSTIYYPDHLGGAEISTKNLAEGFYRKLGYDIAVFCHGLSDSTESINGIKVIRHYFGIPTQIVFSTISGTCCNTCSRIKAKSTDLLKNKAMIDFYRQIMREFDVIIVSGNARNMGRRNIWISASMENIPLVQIVRDPVLLYYKNGVSAKCRMLDRLFRYFSVRDLDCVTQIVGPTNAIIESHNSVGISMRNSQIIPNIVNVNNVRKRGYNEKNNSFLYVGSISTQKGVHSLIKAFISFYDRCDSYELILIGNTSNVVIPTKKGIVYKGHMDLDMVYDEMAKAKLVILPSEWEEAFGRTIVESIMCGTVAIGSNSGGIPELLENDKDFIFEKGNTKQLSQMMKKVARMNSYEYNELLKKQKCYVERFKEQRVVEEWRSLLKNIVNK